MTDIRRLILAALAKHKEVRAADIVKRTGFSRAYVNRFFRALQDEGKIVLVGRANRARYVIARKGAVEEARSRVRVARRLLRNKNLSEDVVFTDIQKNTGILRRLPHRLVDAVAYAFMEMLNNAIEHSGSAAIEIFMEREASSVRFEVIDRGVGIFRHIQRKRGLKNEMEAIQDLLKGKQTTAPEKHTGEGIFFTSKIADRLIIQSGKKKLIFDNTIADIFIRDLRKPLKGTRVIFHIPVKSRVNLEKVFRKYTGEAFAFSKTEVKISLYRMDADFISRSQARRILAGLDKFGTVTLDFAGVDTVGQAFADEVFRVWQRRHPAIKIAYRNANENIDFMIKRALAR